MALDVTFGCTILCIWRWSVFWQYAHCLISRCVSWCIRLQLWHLARIRWTVELHPACPITTICFQMMAIIPLSMLSQFFRKLPMLGSLSQMELRLMLNISQSNLWSATYAAPVGNVHVPASTNACKSVGDTCQFLWTNPGAGLGMRTVGNTPTFTVTSNVGFYKTRYRLSRIIHSLHWMQSLDPPCVKCFW
jgi:hypothetical protein